MPEVVGRLRTPRIATAPATPALGEVYYDSVTGLLRYWNGTLWVATSPKISAYSGGPPASPADGDIWVAAAVDANGTCWQFRYNAGSASAYKWEFIGGADVHAYVVTKETTGSQWGTLADLTTFGPFVPVTRNGDYEFNWCVRCSNNTANVGSIATIVSGSSAIYYDPPVFTSSTANAETMLGMSGRFNGLAAGNDLRLMYCCIGGGFSSFAQRSLLVHPVRIS